MILVLVRFYTVFYIGTHLWLLYRWARGNVSLGPEFVINWAAIVVGIAALVAVSIEKSFWGLRYWRVLLAFSVGVFLYQLVQSDLFLPSMSTSSKVFVFANYTLLVGPPVLATLFLSVSNRPLS